MDVIKKIGPVLLVCALAVCLIYANTVVAGKGVTYGLPQGVYIDLTKEFYEALKAEGNTGTKTYANDMSQEYLRQIAVSAKFMVESNLRILRNQEKIIRLLESIVKAQDKNAK